jgi:hypothetical protein
MSFDLACVNGTDSIDRDVLDLVRESEQPDETQEAVKPAQAERETLRIATMKSAIGLGNFSYTATLAIGEDGELDMIEGSFSGGEADRVQLFDHKYPEQDIEPGKIWADEKFSSQQVKNCFVDLLTINSDEFSAHYSPGDSHADESLTSAQGDSICDKICQAIKSRSIESAALRQLGTADI